MNYPTALAEPNGPIGGLLETLQFVEFGPKNHGSQRRRLVLYKPDYSRSSTGLPLLSCV